MGKIFLNILMANGTCLHFSVERKILWNILMQSVICVHVLVNLGITLLNIPMPKYLKAQLNANCHELTLMVKLVIIIVAYYMPPNRVSNTIMHVILNIINKCTPFIPNNVIYHLELHVTIALYQGHQFLA